jgi:dTDP-4-dehydrorhamnose reductase
VTCILVTGAGGQLGSELARADCAPGIAIVALSRAQLDITDASSVAAAIHTQQPDVVINCAAWTDVDGAETHAEAAFAVNATGPGVLATECARGNVRLIHMSTDYVFDGRSREPIAEDTEPSPLSTYGRSKLAGEWAVQKAAPNHCIVRTSGLYGRQGPNFVLTMLQRAAAQEQLRVVADQVTAPTWTADLAAALLRLVALNAEGVFHLTNAGSTSWHDFAVAAVSAAGYATPVYAMSMAEVNRPATRPQYSVLDNRHWRELGEAPLRGWRHALTDYVNEVGNRALSRAS